MPSLLRSFVASREIVRYFGAAIWRVWCSMCTAMKRIAFTGQRIVMLIGNQAKNMYCNISGGIGA